MSTRILTLFTWIYVAICTLVVVILPPAHHDWFGISRRPHGGVPALLLSLPWSIAMRPLHYHGTAYSTALVVFAMAMNVFLLISLKRRLDKADNKRQP